jgi:hypothetical protein
VFLFDVFRSSPPIHNPMGLGADDFLELALAALLVVFAAAWKSRLAAGVERFAGRMAWCMLALAVAPVALRLALLPHHPIPSPDIYDEFSHLLVADTLRHFRLANAVHPLHRFFETFFVLQEPSYSSIYPIGQGLILALGRALFGQPWAGVVMATAALCSLTYWMLRAWTTPGWALVGGALAVFEFGPLNQWMNGYWGGALPAVAGCLVFGALPRLGSARYGWPAVAMGLGFAIHVLTRPYESIFLVLSVMLYLAPRARVVWRPAGMAVLVALPALGITMLQNKQVTGGWTTLPYALSQYQYGVPAALTFQREAAPHRELTPEQALDYKMQSGFAGGPETVARYAARLGYRVRFYRFFFLPPLYVAVLAFVFRLREARFAWVAGTLGLFALGMNFFPAWQFHYVAAETCLFVLVSVAGLERLSRVSAEASRVVVFLCAVHFLFWYVAAMGADETGKPERRIAVARGLAATPGRLLVLVRYGARHIFQEEWVWNEAEMDAARVVWARDSGAEENAKLMKYYAGREVWVLDADVRPLPVLERWVAPVPAKEAPAPEKPKAREGLHFEPVPEAPR